MDSLDFYELAMYLTGNSGEDEDELEQAFFDKFEIDYHLAFGLVKNLVPLCNVGQSPMTEKYYRGFGTADTWLVKQEIIIKKEGS